jgi:hypothetical protein
VCTAAAWLLAACGVSAPDGQGIRGLVLLGPNCPVEQEGVPCPDSPYQVELTVTNPEGTRVVKTFSSLADGTFEVTLPAGEYAIRSTAPGGFPYCATDQPVMVSAGRMTETTVFCDTGIR